MAEMNKESKTLEELSAEDCNPATPVEEYDAARKLWSTISSYPLVNISKLF